MVGKPCICATQMLESMTVNPRPTRAEVSDVANAVLDGADCVMLSGETAKGQYPLEAVTVMAKICIEAESAIFYRPLFNEMRRVTEDMDTTESIASSAVNASSEIEAAAIIVLTTSGATARMVAKYRPKCPIITVTRSGSTSRFLHLYRGCYPLHYSKPRPADGEWQDDVEDRIAFAIKRGKDRLGIPNGVPVVCVQGWTKGIGFTNTLRIINT